MDRTRNFVFGARVIGDNAKEYTLGLMARQRNKAMLPVAGEVPKSDAELHFIALANHYLRQALESFGLTYADIAPERIHLLSAADYVRTMGYVARGGYDSGNGGIYVDKEGISRARLYHCLLHECLHAQSFQKTLFDWRPKRSFWFFRMETPCMATMRTGYNSGHYDLGNYFQRFLAFNEILTDQFAAIMLQLMREEMVDHELLTADERDDLPLAYHEYLPLVHAAMRSDGVEKYDQNVFMRLLRGMFSGEMMLLRSFERRYGPGSLRILSAIGGGTRRSRLERLLGPRIVSWLRARGIGILPLYSREEEATLALWYFENNDDTERSALAEKLLNKREWRAWLRRRRLAGRFAK